MIKSEVYSPGRSLEHSAPLKLHIDIAYFSLAHRRPQCKHRCVPMTFGSMDGFYDFCFLSCISCFSNSWQKLHLHLSATKDEGQCVHKPARLELSELMPALTVSFCRGHLLLLQSVTRPWCAQFHSCHAEYFKLLVFCQVRTHSQTERSSQDKARPGKSLFLFWHCSLEQEGTDPRTVTAGVCLWRRFKTQT